jgi:hypothetical protein
VALDLAYGKIRVYVEIKAAVAQGHVLQPDRVQCTVDLLHPKVIAVVKLAKALVYVDVMGKINAREGWQTDRPSPLVEWLRAKGYKKT